MASDYRSSPVICSFDNGRQFCLSFTQLDFLHDNPLKRLM